jgi:predicted metal-dependent peptidase
VRDARPERLDQTRLAAARLVAADAQPFLAIALYALTAVADESQPTCAVDEQWRLYVNPRRLAEWPVEQTAGVLLHEVSHVIRDHASRARAVHVADERARYLWNLAADAEINDDLIAAHIELPPQPVVPRLLGMPAGKVAEYYYAHLCDESAPPPDLLPEGVNCGSGCHGQGDTSDPASPPPGLSEVEATLLRRRVAEEIAQLARHHPGNVPAGWMRWAEALLRPSLDWRVLLAAKVRSSAAAVSGAVDYSYARPPRRRVPGVVLPSLRRPIPRVAVIVDTSGSVSLELLRLAWTEVHGCLRSTGTRRDLISVYAADAAVHLLPGLLHRQMPVPGGGGTDMAAAIDTALAARPKPDVVVVITDGLTPWPTFRPSRAVIVALLPTRLHRPEPPSWAQVVHVSGAA